MMSDSKSHETKKNRKKEENVLERYTKLKKVNMTEVWKNSQDTKKKTKKPMQSSGSTKLLLVIIIIIQLRFVFCFLTDCFLKNVYFLALSLIFLCS